MTSGYMNCPGCESPFQYAHFETDSNWQDIWVEIPEPWECPHCKVLIITDKEKGYGLQVTE